jgi:DNA-binding LytR/AlgR family response regulator
MLGAGYKTNCEEFTMQERRVRVVIADDDEVQLNSLRTMIESLRPNWQIVGGARDAKQLGELIEQCAPNILVLDIHLPGGAKSEAAFDVLASLNYRCGVVFVTGDPNLAVQAFELAVADYLVKPVRAARLNAALDRAAWVAFAPGEGINPGVSQPSSRLRWLTACKGLDTVVIPSDDVVYLQAERKYTKIFYGRSSALVRQGITQMEAMLDPDAFARVHRSTVVNLKHVDLARRDEMGRLRLHLVGRSETLLVSRPFEHMFRAL